MYLWHNVKQGGQGQNSYILSVSETIAHGVLNDISITDDPDILCHARALELYVPNQTTPVDEPMFYN